MGRVTLPGTRLTPFGPLRAACQRAWSDSKSLQGQHRKCSSHETGCSTRNQTYKLCNILQHAHPAGTSTSWRFQQDIPLSHNAKSVSAEETSRKVSAKS